MSSSPELASPRGLQRFARSRRARAALVLVAAALLLFLGWNQLTRRRGAQQVSFLPATQTCSSAGELRYCVYSAPGGTSGDIVYHLHGRNLDERVWNDDTYYTGLLQAEWQRTGTRPPTVISVSYGPTWLLTPRGKEAASGLLDDFVARIAELEARVGTPRRRLLLGESMGGLNVLVAGLSHPSMFAKVAALCPGVYRSSPFAPLSTIRDDVRRTGADPKIVLGIWLLARRYVADEAEWQRMSPLSLIDRAGAQAPALYLSCGLYDAYGNFEGTQRLAELAARHGVPTDWRPLYGGHCAIDVPSLASFLAREVGSDVQ